jgi:hypothetical protein
MIEENKKEELATGNEQEVNDENTSSNENIADAGLTTTVTSSTDETSDIIHHKSDTEDMETHAHELHKAPGHGWKHYFFEFFMLFLAVTLGFFVENQREHYIEHQREKKYAALLYEDLKKDSSTLNDAIDLKRWRAVKLDSLLLLLRIPDLKQQSTALYYYSIFPTLNLPFKPNDATMQQLRSSGNLRYFNNPKLYNAITNYYSNCSFYLDREGNTSTQMPVNVNARIFDANDVASLIAITPSMKDAVSYPKKEMALLTTDKQVINEFTYNSINSKATSDVTLMLLQFYIKPQLVKLIEDLKTEYHLE